jgi:hypothetical protein
MNRTGTWDCEADFFGTRELANDTTPERVTQSRAAQQTRERKLNERRKTGVGNAGRPHLRVVDRFPKPLRSILSFIFLSRCVRKFWRFLIAIDKSIPSFPTQ